MQKKQQQQNIQEKDKASIIEWMNCFTNKLKILKNLIHSYTWNTLSLGKYFIHLSSEIYLGEKFRWSDFIQFLIGMENIFFMIL